MNTIQPKIKPYTRFEIYEEEYQDFSKISASLLKQSELPTARKIFKKFDIQFSEKFLDEKILYTLDLTTEKKGTYQEFRTQEETIQILCKYFHLEEKKAKSVFNSALKETWKEGFQQVSITVIPIAINPSPKKARDTIQNQKLP